MVLGGCGWFWVVVDGFGWFWVVVDGFGSFLVLVSTLCEKDLGHLSQTYFAPFCSCTLFMCWFSPYTFVKFFLQPTEGRSDIVFAAHVLLRQLQN